ncbi:MAG: type II secretion system F family protein [Gammaproteobacteria bacterium]|nr:type II secretion system F family protein [Gammaproteobacteria bacterium]NIO61782.1 type II secretion system F family protein [Gammaproteobacteria bacterium]NIP48652.1 type II secretion system F family protein [Gammaproteobacteria bacterium]NIQ09104.1 type II secretion system F family protein [Gammaproteobacteria bacterium]NIQ19033.1 type II secretion system F family protein [Gammaproteobacteria bacterium]
MEAFQYKAVDDQGRMTVGKIDAVNIADLETRLDRMGLDLVNYKDLGPTGPKITGVGVSRRDLITFCFHLEQTSRAGVPILESLEDLRDSSDNPRLREVIAAMIDSIEGGQTLSQAMRNYPAVFDSIFCNLVSAGEQSGEIAQVFYQLGENLKWQDEQAAQTKKLLIYPAFVGTIVIAVVFFLMVYLVPELLRFVKTMGQELPMHTKILIVVSNAFVQYWYLFVLIPVLVVAGLIIAVRVNETARYQYDAFKLKIPIIGPILRKIILTRLTSFFAMMYASGITIIECIRTGEQIVGNKVIEQAMHQVGQHIADGATLSTSFERTELFPPLVLRMIRVGENTGALEESLINISYFYTRDIKESIEKLQSMIEPTMTVVLGAIIGWVMLSVLGPIYDLITKVKI